MTTLDPRPSALPDRPAAPQPAAQSARFTVFRGAGMDLRFHCGSPGIRASRQQGYSACSALADGFMSVVYGALFPGLKNGGF
jgi:hypothetical protein